MDFLLFIGVVFLMSSLGFIVNLRKNGESAVLGLTSLSSGLFLVFSIGVEFFKRL